MSTSRGNGAGTGPIRAGFVSSMKPERRTRLMQTLAKRLAEEAPVVESDYFMRCPMCGQFYDVRDDTEVYYHDDRPHPPMKADA